MRITTAVTHKSVTFARAIDWIDESFKASHLVYRRKTEYQSAYGVFHRVRLGTATPEVKEWAEQKAKRWGVAVATIEHWLHTKENLAPDLLEEVKAGSRHDVPHRTFEKLATILPQQAELQKLVLEKAEKEDLTSTWKTSCCLLGTLTQKGRWGRTAGRAQDKLRRANIGAGLKPAPTFVLRLSKNDGGRTTEFDKLVTNGQTYASALGRGSVGLPLHGHPSPAGRGAGGESLVTKDEGRSTWFDKLTTNGLSSLPSLGELVLASRGGFETRPYV